MSPLNASLRRLVFLAPLAATAVLGGSALGDPAAACAEPKQWNEAGYHACVDQLNKDLAAGRYTPEQYIELVQGSCSLSGGAWNNTLKQCESPSGARPRTSGSSAAGSGHADSGTRSSGGNPGAPGADHGDFHSRTS
jgi:hypothetical protein